jgi:hypothetical protein
MTSIPEAAKLIKGGFIRLDPQTNAIIQILAFETNPATLSRSLPNPPEATPNPELHEVIRFTLILDPPQGISAATAGIGIYPLLSALELPLYVPAGSTKTIPPIIFAWGHLRVLPVRPSEFEIVEQKFDAELNPIHAEISVVLQVLKDADLPPDCLARRLWDEHLIELQRLASQVPAATLADLAYRPSSRISCTPC